MTTKIDSVAGRIRVTGDMTVYTASQLKQPLLDALVHGPADVTLDLSEVADFDTAGVQLLLLLQREALVNDRNLQFVTPSGTVREVLGLFGALGLLVDGGRSGSRP